MASRDTIVVKTRSIVGQASQPTNAARKLATKMSVWMIIEVGDPIPRVTVSANFSTGVFGMGEVYTDWYTLSMEFTPHAYVARGGADGLEQLLQLLEKSGIETKGNPDVLVRTYASFTIDDARSLRERASLRAVGERGRI